jgi:hypothetical protein
MAEPHHLAVFSQRLSIIIGKLNGLSEVALDWREPALADELLQVSLHVSEVRLELLQRTYQPLPAPPQEKVREAQLDLPF